MFAEREEGREAGRRKGETTKVERCRIKVREERGKVPGPQVDFLKSSSCVMMVIQPLQTQVYFQEDW